MDASVILRSVPCPERVPAALGRVVVRRHVRFGHEDEEFLDVALNAPAQFGLNG